MSQSVLLAGSLGIVATSVAAEKESPPRPLARAHAHNDYEHPRPLLDALAQGFVSVEADIYLIDGQLLVAHDRRDTKPDRTLQALYLDPLRERVKKNGGRVFPGGPPALLMIDVKSEAVATYTALRTVLKEYAPMLTVFHADRTETNAVTVVISGNRARELMAAETERLAGYDGRLEDLAGKDSRHLIPLVSDNWRIHFQWRGFGEIPVAERKKLLEIVARAHSQGRRVRFWAVPDQKEGWEELFAAGVDLLNTDHLAGLAEFLRGR